MMDYIASLMQRGLISPDVAQGLAQQINYWQNKGIQPPILEQGGAGSRIGANTTREPLLGYSNPKPAENANKTKIQRYNDALLYDQISPAEHQGFMDALGVDRSLSSKMADRIQNQRKQLLQSTREQFGGMRDEGELKQEFIDEYDALVRQKAAKENRADFRTIKGDKTDQEQ